MCASVRYVTIRACVFQNRNTGPKGLSFIGTLDAALKGCSSTSPPAALSNEALSDTQRSASTGRLLRGCRAATTSPKGRPGFWGSDAALKGRSSTVAPAFSCRPKDRAIRRTELCVSAVCLPSSLRPSLHRSPSSPQTPARKSCPHFSAGGEDRRRVRSAGAGRGW